MRQRDIKMKETPLKEERMYESESKKKKKWKGRQTERREIGHPVRAVAIHGISYFTKKMIFTYNPGRGGIKKNRNFNFFQTCQN